MKRKPTGRKKLDELNSILPYVYTRGAANLVVDEILGDDDSETPKAEEPPENLGWDEEQPWEEDAA